MVILPGMPTGSVYSRRLAAAFVLLVSSSTVIAPSLFATVLTPPSFEQVISHSYHILRMKCVSKQIVQPPSIQFPLEVISFVPEGNPLVGPATGPIDLQFLLNLPDSPGELFEVEKSYILALDDSATGRPLLVAGRFGVFNIEVTGNTGAVVSSPTLVLDAAASRQSESQRGHAVPLPVFVNLVRRPQAR